MNRRTQLFVFAAASALLTACAPQKPGKVDATAAEKLEAENLALVKQLYADFAAGNIEAFTAALAADIVWNEAEHNPYLPNSPYLGLDAVMSGVFTPLGEDWASFNVNPEQYLSDGDTVAMFGRYDAQYKATGKTMQPQVVHVWTVKDGKLSSFQQYADTAAMRDVMTPDAALGG